LAAVGRFSNRFIRDVFPGPAIGAHRIRYRAARAENPARARRTPLALADRDKRLLAGSAHVASRGYELKALVATQKLFIDFVHLERGEIEETGAYDLDGLFVRIEYASKSVGAKTLSSKLDSSAPTGKAAEDTLRAILLGEADADKHAEIF